MAFPAYSVAIRTLGLNKALLKKELESINNQSLAPSKIIIYIAEGYSIPDFRVTHEEYVYVKKGMVSQRALEYKEIDTDYILLLDDDVYLEPKCVEILLSQFQRFNIDCIACDVFRHREMSLSEKVMGFILNSSYPSKNQKGGFIIHRGGNYSYNVDPTKDFLPSQSGSGPISLWKTDALRRIDFRDEKWIDDLGYPFGEDQLMFYKAYVNGLKPGVYFPPVSVHMDAQTSGGGKAGKRAFNQACATYLIWHRTIYQLQSTRFKRTLAVMAITERLLRQCVLSLLRVIKTGSFIDFRQYVKGIKEGMRMARTERFRTLPSFLVDERK